MPLVYRRLSWLQPNEVAESVYGKTWYEAAHALQPSVLPLPAASCCNGATGDIYLIPPRGSRPPCCPRTVCVVHSDSNTANVAVLVLRHARRAT